MQDNEYESLMKVVRGMGGSFTAGEVSKAMAALGLSVKNVEELLTRAVADDVIMKNQNGDAYQYQLKVSAKIRPIRG